jgi:tRNA modification GTPase
VFAADDTIVAVATPAGRGGVAMARLSGPAAHDIALGLAGRRRPLSARRATRARLGGLDLADDALLIYFPSPASYTGEDVVEISTHGSPVVMAAVIAAATARGARPARPGEFTLRAFLHGKLDLLQAEAVQALVDAVSPAEARAAVGQLDGALSAAVARVAAAIRELHLRLEASIDFPDEGYHFIDSETASSAVRDLRDQVAALVDGGAQARRLHDGYLVVVAGAPNVGKSSVFNALVGGERAIVTPVAGTTRDLVSEHVLIGDAHLRLVDTAGVRGAADVVEREGIRRATGAAAAADLVLVVLDRSRPLDADDRQVLGATAAQARLVVANKGDLPAAWREGDYGVELTVSAVSGEGFAKLASALASHSSVGAGAADVLVVNERQRARLRETLEHLQHACTEIDASGGAVPEEFLAADLVRAGEALDELTGVRAADDVLGEIFSRFCIGK